MQYSSNPIEGIGAFFWRHKKIGRICALAILLAALLLCFVIGSRYSYGGQPAPRDEETVQTNYPALAIRETDLDQEPENVDERNLSECTDICEITRGGDYRLSGELNGMVYISAEDQQVHLFLDGVRIHSDEGPAIYCETAEFLQITLLPGTENFISDSGDYRESENQEACIFARCDLTMNGSGALTVNGYYKDAIRSQDVLRVTDGTYTVKCKRTGLHGTDGIHVSGGRIMISSEKNGMRTTKNGRDGRGCLIVSGGEHSVIAGRYAFVAEKSDAHIYNCIVRSKSTVASFDVGGTAHVQEGCVK